MSALEDWYVRQLTNLGLPEPVREHRFAPPRRWRFDAAWPEHQVAVEIEGGTFSGGRHTRGAGYEHDLEKYNAAALAGWCLLRFSRSFVASGEAARMTALALAMKAAA